MRWMDTWRPPPRWWGAAPRGIGAVERPWPRGPYALRRIAMALELEREALDRRLEMLETLEGRLGRLIDDEDDLPLRPHRHDNHNGARPAGARTRRDVLHELFQRMPAAECTVRGYPRLAYINAALEEHGLPPLESTAKLRLEFDRWLDEVGVA